MNLHQLAVDMARAEEGFTQIEGGIDWEVQRREFNAEMDLEMEAELRSWQHDQWADADDHVD